MKKKVLWNGFGIRKSKKNMKIMDQKEEPSDEKHCHIVFCMVVFFDSLYEICSKILKESFTRILKIINEH